MVGIRDILQLQTVQSSKLCILHHDKYLYEPLLFFFFFFLKSRVPPLLCTHEQTHSHTHTHRFSMMFIAVYHLVSLFLFYPFLYSVLYLILFLLHFYLANANALLWSTLGLEPWMESANTHYIHLLFCFFQTGGKRVIEKGWDLRHRYSRDRTPGRWGWYSEVSHPLWIVPRIGHQKNYV